MAEIMFPGVHALIIDDNPLNVEVLHTLLQRHQVKTTVITNVRNIALSLADGAPLHVVFLDLEFPNGDGFDVLLALRNLPQLQGVPIVAYTVHTSEIDKARRLGFDGFLGKPLNLHEFPAQLQTILSGGRVWSVQG